MNRTPEQIQDDREFLTDIINNPSGKNFLYTRSTEPRVYAVIVGWDKNRNLGVAQFENTGFTFVFEVSGPSKYVAVRETSEVPISRYEIDTVADSDGVLWADITDNKYERSGIWVTESYVLGL